MKYGISDGNSIVYPYLYKTFILKNRNNGQESSLCSQIPLCINVLRLLNYRLAPDELILFDWLTVKQISFKYKPFHYSQARVEEETVSAVPGRKSS